MTAFRTAAAFARTHKKHLIIGHVAAAVIGVLIAFLAGAFAASAYFHTIHGVKLTPRGVQIYNRIAARQPEKGGKRTGDVALTPEQIAALKESASAAAKQLHPDVQATPQPTVLDQPLTTNYGTRPAGAKYELLVAHDTESPNAPGVQDLEAIRAWFSNPNAQASANYVDDAQGNALEMVNPAARMAWHVAYFNPWAIGVEQVGYASQTRWPLLQVEATARIFAHWATKYGIPIQRGQVSGCTIIRPGIVFHADLGLCGGGHHDPGAHYPIGELIRLTRMYADAGQPHHPRRANHHGVRLPNRTLRQGDHGAAVRDLQKLLDEHGAHLSTDGAFGPATFDAVEHFQHHHHLAVDGVVGPITRRYLNR